MTKDSIFLIFFLIFAGLAGVFILNGGHVDKSISCGTYKTEQIFVNDKSVDIEISDSDCKRILGLSGRKKLTEDTGMLFVFEDEEPHGIWMKDMNFSIDILWLNSEKQIVLIEKKVHPATYPGIFGEDLVSKYVIELPAGFADINNIKEGDIFSF